MHALNALALDPYVRDWLDLLVRGLHVIAGISWIGASFYFVLLDSQLRRPADPDDEVAGVKGELWEVHGGGFYHVQKYQVVPNELPSHLAWFKWEAYTTWLSGFALFVILYWSDARAYMIDPTIADIGPWTAVGISAGLLVAAWLVYGAFCRYLGRRPTLMALAMVAGTALAAWGTSELFTPRTAWLQVGAMLGTIMAANVFFNIIPAHWELIHAKEQGRDPDPAPGIEAKVRSVHNNYLTLPVLLTMLAGHFSFLTGQDHAWVVLLALMAIAAWVRHFFNRHHQGKTSWAIPVTAAVALLVLAVLLRPDDGGAGAGGSAKDPSSPAHANGGPTTGKVDGAQVFADAGCAACHTLAAAKATGNIGPNLDSKQPDEARVRDRVTNGKGGMPSFRGKLDEEEIDAVSEYVASSAGE